MLVHQLKDGLMCRTESGATRYLQKADPIPSAPKLYFDFFLSEVIHMARHLIINLNMHISTFPG